MQGELLGSGSCGQVFLGLNVDTGRLIAVKQVEHRRDSVSNMNGVRQAGTVIYVTRGEGAQTNADVRGTCGFRWSFVVGHSSLVDGRCSASFL